MKTLRLVSPLLVIVILAIIVLNVSAQPEIPEGVQVFYLEGMTCVLWLDGSGDCYCPCDPVCPWPIETPTPRDSPTPRNSPTPQRTPTPQDTPIPSSTPTPDPTKEEKPKCNRGLGNLDEGCDPGNSGGRPGAAGEDNEPRGPHP